MARKPEGKPRPEIQAIITNTTIKHKGRGEEWVETDKLFQLRDLHGVVWQKNKKEILGHKRTDGVQVMHGPGH